MSTFVSPKQLMLKARAIQLDGSKPDSPKDWMKLIVYMSHQIDEDLAVSAIQLMMMIYNCPLQDWEVASICKDELDIINQS